MTPTQFQNWIKRVQERDGYGNTTVARIAMTRHINRSGEVWIRVFPDKPFSERGFKGSRKSTPFAVQMNIYGKYRRISRPGLRIYKENLVEGGLRGTRNQAVIGRMVGHKLGEFSPTRTLRGYAVGRKRDFRKLWITRINAALWTRAPANKVVFDRGGYLYHGRIKALADAAREAGLKF